MLSVFIRHKIITAILLLPLVVLLAVAGFVRYRMQGPYRDYAVDLVLPTPGAWPAIGSLEVGVAARDITPVLAEKDPWVDVNEDSKFDPDIDTWEDKNGNGDFDFVWLAGFDNHRPAKGINDPLWARALAFRNNGVTAAIVSVDSIGLTHDLYIAVRKMIQEKNPQVSHVTFAATHSHQAPDTMGLYSYGLLWNSHFDEDYLRQVQEGARDAVLAAVENLRPADAVIVNGQVPEENFIYDSRDPQVMDHQLPLAWFKEKGTENTIAVLASWGMHPEAMGGNNPYVSSDFVHYFRKSIEEGLEGPGGFPAFGGTCVYFSGPLGGLMTQLDIAITDRHGNAFKDDSADKARAHGENLAILAANALRGPGARPMAEHGVACCARTFYVAMGGPYKAALYLGLVHPGVYDGKVRSEIDAFRVGEIEMLTTPGELFPEIAFGGIENPEGADFRIPPAEAPPFVNAMGSAVNMVFNLGNDEIGYIVPKSQWDQEAPYTYGNKEAPYGEEYTGNPDVAPEIHRVSMSVLQDLHNTLESAPAAGQS